jgi:hypothetical protein
MVEKSAFVILPSGCDGVITKMGREWFLAKFPHTAKTPMLLTQAKVYPEHRRFYVSTKAGEISESVSFCPLHVFS